MRLPIHLEPRQTSGIVRSLYSFDRVAEVYDVTRGLPPEAEAAISAGIVRVLGGIATTPRLLDVGVGTGRIAVPVAAAGLRVFGVDVAPRMLARLRAKRDDIALVRAEATALPFRGSSFDGALFVHLLHLVRDPGTVVHAAALAVRPGGMLLFGRTDYSESARRAVIPMIREIVAELTGAFAEEIDRHAAANAVFAQVAARLGAAVGESVLADWRERTTGAQLLDQLARRVYSTSWSIPDEIMPELLRRLAPRVEALLGTLDAVIENDASFTLITARLPA